jgi:low affinity Fe/Cu permease
MAERFSRWAARVAALTGSYAAFLLALLVVLVWALTGPLFGFSATWQLVINTGTTVVTFLMVFLIQRSQNIDAHAVQIKLNELVASAKGASNRLINVEDLSEQELDVLHPHFARLVELARKETITASHSVEEAEKRHDSKKRNHR